MLTDLLPEAEALLDGAVDLRRRLHRQPELGLELPQTKAAVLDALSGFGLEITEGEGLSSVVGVLEGSAGPGPTILLRADMDALPMPEDTGLEFASSVDGAMHACGHDAHVAMLVGAAELLSSRRSSLAGRVVFAFQPGEEGFGGAKIMLDEGLASGGVDAAFALHVTPNQPSGQVAIKGGPLLASADTVYVTVRGSGGHASAPHNATDPVPVAAELILAFQTLVTRTIDVFKPAVLSITRLDAGTASNVIPEEARLTGTLRTTRQSTRQTMWDGIERVAHGIAAAHECEADVTIKAGYPPTVNDAAVADRVMDIAARSFGPERVTEMAAPAMGAEDFSYILEEVPGAMAFLGVCPEGSDPRRAASLHSNRMMLDERAMATGIAMHAAFALDHLSPA